MTPQEAIDWCDQFRDNIIKTGVQKEKYTLALRAMRTAMTALAKQIPQQPDLEGDGYYDGELVYDTGYCPCCRQDYEIEYHAPKFCENCGQALDWGDLNA